MNLGEIKNRIAAALLIKSEDLVYPPSNELGDLSWPLFGEAKKKQESPVSLAIKKAQELAKREDLHFLVKEFRPVGPYLNIFLNREVLMDGVLKEIKVKSSIFGREYSKRSKRAVMIEYSNGNTHKEYHVGHLRNIIYGESVRRLLDATGHKAIAVSYINDFGIHIAKTIWNFKRDLKFLSMSGAKGYILGQCYSEATKKMAELPESKEEVSEIMKEIESRQGDNYLLWKKTRNWSIAYFNEVYRELGIKFRKTFYESEEIAEGLRLVEKLLSKGILKKSEGAVIADLEKHGLGVLPIIRSDGTALYPVADLALAFRKFKEYPLEESIYVVDVRQSLYFKQMFKILSLAGYQEKMTHLAYDFVTLKSGMMSSRSGNVVTYQELFEESFKKTKEETQKRHADWPMKKIEMTAKKIAISAMKFEMIKVSPEKVIVFDLEEAMKFDGYTAAYLQYTGARINSLVRKDKKKQFWQISRLNSKILIEPKEFLLSFKLAQYPEIVMKSGEDRDPSSVCRYLFELAQQFNDYYHDVNILKAEPKVKEARLYLVSAVGQVLHCGFSLLGIDYLKEM